MEGRGEIVMGKSCGEWGIRRGWGLLEKSLWRKSRGKEREREVKKSRRGGEEEMDDG
jgi:hypothetical protein